MLNTRIFSLLTLFFFVGISLRLEAQYIPPEKRKKNPSDSLEKKIEKPELEREKRASKPSALADRSFVQRLTPGGNFWLQFGNPTRVDLLPTLGYRFSEKFIAGIGINYQYFNARYDLINQAGQRVGELKVNESYYGGRLFAQYFIIPQIFAWAEYDATNGNFFNQRTGEFNKTWIFSPLLGGGYNQSFGESGLGFYALVLYNFNFDENQSQYNSPIITRVGFNF